MPAMPVRRSLENDARSLENNNGSQLALLASSPSASSKQPRGSAESLESLDERGFLPHLHTGPHAYSGNRGLPSALEQEGFRGSLPRLVTPPEAGSIHQRTSGRTGCAGFPRRRSSVTANLPPLTDALPPLADTQAPRVSLELKPHRGEHSAASQGSQQDMGTSTSEQEAYLNHRVVAAHRNRQASPRNRDLFDVPKVEVGNAFPGQDGVTATDLKNHFDGHSGYLESDGGTMSSTWSKAGALSSTWSKAASLAKLPDAAASTWSSAGHLATSPAKRRVSFSSSTLKLKEEEEKGRLLQGVLQDLALHPLLATLHVDQRSQAIFGEACADLKEFFLLQQEIRRVVDKVLPRDLVAASCLDGLDVAGAAADELEQAESRLCGKVGATLSILEREVARTGSLALRASWRSAKGLTGPELHRRCLLRSQAARRPKKLRLVRRGQGGWIYEQVDAIAEEGEEEDAVGEHSEDGGSEAEEEYREADKRTVPATAHWALGLSRSWPPQPSRTDHMICASG